MLFFETHFFGNMLCDMMTSVVSVEFSLQIIDQIIHVSFDICVDQSLIY